MNRNIGHLRHNPGWRTVRGITVIGLLYALFASLLVPPRLAQAAPGPGVPAVTFTSSQLFTPLSRFNSSTRNAPGFHGFSFMHDGYLILTRSGNCCSGGGFNVYNISDPRNPVLVKRVDRASQREGHTVGSSYFNGKKYIVMLASTGINFWDMTDAANPILVREMTLPNI